MSGASDSAKNFAVSTKGAAGSTDVFVAKQKAAQTELKATATAAKGTSTAMKALSIAGNMLLFTAITAGISLVTKAIDNYIHKSEIMLEKAEEASSKIQDTNSQFESHKKTVEECATTYEKLSKGVDTLSNKNISLSDDDYEEYLRVTNELAEAFPQLRVTVDENGDSIIQFSDKTKTATENLEAFLEQEKQTANYKIAQSLPDLFGGVVAKQGELSKAKTALNELNQEMESFNRLSSGVTKGKNIFSGTGDYSNIYNTLVIALDKYRNSLIETGKVMDASLNPELLINAQQNTNGEYKIEFDTSGIEDIDKLSEYIADAFQDIDETVTDSLGDARTALNGAQAEFDTAWVDFRGNLISAMQSKASYQGLDTASKQLADALVGNLPSEIASQMDDDDPYKWISDNIISQLRNIEDPSIKEEFQSKIQELLSFEEGDLNIVSFAEELQRWLDANGIYIDITPIIKDEQEAKAVLQKSINNIAGTNGATFGDKNIEDRKKLEEYTKNFTEAERQHWLTVTNGINGADNAIKAYEESLANANTNETSIPSIIDSWNSLIDTDVEELKNTRKDLLELAEAGQLTAETFHDTTGADTFLDGISESLPEVIEWINQLVSASTQLQSMSAQISKMSDMLADKKNGTTASASDLAGFDVTVKGLESWEEFERVMGSSKSSMEECQAAADALATEWVNNGNFLANLTEENKDYYIYQLKSMGIENAAAVVTETLTDKKEALRLKYLALNAVLTDFEGKTSGACARLLEQEGATDQTKAALADLITQEILFNNSSLDVSGKISALNQLALAAYGVSDALTSGMGLDSRYYNGKTTEERAVEKMGILSSAQKVTTSPISISPTGSRNYKPTGGGSSSEDTKQTIDWIERRVKFLNNHIDLTQSKLENLSNIKSPKDLGKKIDAVSKKLKTASENTEKWKTNLSKIKIPDDAKKLIQNGKSVDLSKYSKAEQQNIKKYQSTWKKYTSAKKKENSLYDQKWNLETQRGKAAYLKSQEKDYNTLAKVEEKAYKKYMKKANSIKLSDSLKEKVRNGDYNINDYSSKQQELIQEYQNWYDKAQESLIAKQEAKKNARDKKVERYQLYVDDAEAKIAKSQALAALDEGNYKKQNIHLKSQENSLKKSYKWQIKIAEAEGKTLEADRLRAELQQKLRDLSKEEFDNIATTFEYKISHLDNFVQDLSNSISDIENRGLIAGASYYNSQISYHNKIKDQLVAEKEELTLQLKTLDRFKPEWRDALETIQEVENSIAETNSTIKQLQNSINEIANTLSSNIVSSFKSLNDEADLLVTLLGDNLTDDDFGNLTKEGIAALGLYNQQMNVSKATAGKLLAEINSIQNAIDTGTYGNFRDSNGMERHFASVYEAESRIKDLYADYRSEISNTYSYESKIVDLMKQKYQSELAYVKELIDQKKELLNSEKDLYDYSRSIKEQSDNINSLRKQIAALQGDASLENKSRIQKLEKQLKDQQDELKDKEYDRFISDQQNMLDNLSKEYSDLIESVSKDRDTLLKEGIQVIDANGSNIQDTINSTASEYSLQLTSEMKTATNNITGGLSAIKQILDQISAHLAAQIVEQQKNVEEDLSESSNLKENPAITAILKNGSNTTPKSELTKAIAGIYGNGLNRQEIADVSRLLGLNYELKDFQRGSTIEAQAKQAVLEELVRQGYLKKSGNKYLQGFSNGGVISSINDAIRLNGDKVLISGEPGERMLTDRQNGYWEKWTEAIPNLINFAETIKPNVNVPNAIDRNIGGVTYGGNNQINIELPNVTNYEDFMRKFQSDPKAEQLVQHMTASVLTNNSSRLGKYNIKF